MLEKTPEAFDKASLILFYGIFGSDDEFKRPARVVDAPNCKAAPESAKITANASSNPLLL